VPRTLIAVLATTLTLLAAPAAHAGWVTGAGTPPVFQATPVCQDGMVFHYATFLPDGSTTDPNLKLYDLQVFVPDTGYAYKEGNEPLLAGGTFLVPREPFYIDPKSIGGSIGAWLPLRMGWFDYHAAIELRFRAAPGTTVQVRWHRSPDASAWSGNWRYTVDSCWL
jgi:hypothetical protein